MATPPPLDTAEDIGGLLAHLLAGAAGGTEAKWKRVVGPVEKLPTWRYVRFNWRVTPQGTADQRELVEKAVKIVRAEHPYVAT